MIVGAIRTVVSILVAIALLILAAVAIWLFMTKPTDRETLKFAAATIGGSMAIFGAFFAFISASAGAAQTRRARSLEIIDQLNKLEMVEERFQLESDLTKVGDIYGHVTADPLKHARLTHLLGMFEDIAQAINLNVADERVLYDSLDFILPTAFKQYQSFIMAERNACGDPRLYKHLEDVVNAWNSQKSYRSNRKKKWMNP